MSVYPAHAPLTNDGDTKFSGAVYRAVANGHLCAAFHEPVVNRGLIIWALRG
jgi:hypothetical protein